MRGLFTRRLPDATFHDGEIAAEERAGGQTTIEDRRRDRPRGAGRRLVLDVDYADIRAGLDGRWFGALSITTAHGYAEARRA